MVRILILEDDPLFGQTLRDRLLRERPFPWEVVYVEAAETAVAAVQHSSTPFNIFLIDQRLGPGADGITVMQQLRTLNPQADAIIFTGLNDLDSGLRAIRAGAYRFLTKPFATEELILILRTVLEHQQMQDERDWLRILNGISEKIQHSLVANEIAQHLVAGGLQLGYERVKVWRLCPDRTHLLSLQFGGMGQFDHPVSLPLAESPYARRVIEATEPQTFMGLELGAWYLDRVVKRPLFPPPHGQWICIPLRTGNNRCLGMLTFDNVEKNSTLEANQVQLLALLGRHAAAALERADLHETEQRKRAEMNILFQIGKKVIERAALDDLPKLLQAVREQVGRLMEISNFLVVLVDPETGVLETRLEVVRDERVPHERQIPPHGLIGHIIRRGRGIVLPQGSAEYRQKHGLPLLGEPAKSWMGSVLRMEGRGIGALVLESNDREEAYDRDDWMLLNHVSDLIAGAIQLAQAGEQERRDKEQLAILQRVSQEMMALAEERREWLWHALLTAATASYGLGFNRAMVLMVEPQTQELRGVYGIGHLDGAAARADWERDVAAGMSFELYLQRLRAGDLPELPLQEQVVRISLPWSPDLGVFYQAVTEQRRILVAREEVRDVLPAAFVDLFGETAYAVEPLWRGSEGVGVVVLDNIHNERPLRLKALSYLQPVLSQGMSTLQYLQERDGRDGLLRVGHRVMAQAAHYSLQETLLDVARAGQEIAGADFVVIHPLRAEERPFVFDSLNSVGVDKVGRPFPVKPPRRNGLTDHILRSGTLLVEDVQTHEQLYAGQPLAKHSHFKGQKLRSVAATPVQELGSGRQLGVLYFMYRQPRRFTTMEVKQVQLFGSLTAVAIQTAHTAQSVRNDLHLAQTATQSQARELGILRDVLQEALVPDLTETKVSRVLLEATARLLRQPQTRIRLFLQHWQAGQRYQDAPQLEWQQYGLDQGSIVTQNRGLGRHVGLVEQVFQTGESVLIGDVTAEPWGHPAAVTTRAELDIAIHSGEAVIGVLNMESDLVGAFSEADKAAGERLAYVAGLALSNLQRQNQFRHVLTAMSAVTQPTGLPETLESIVTVLRQTFPELSCLTIWYRLPGSEEVIPGPHFGIMDEEALVSRLSDKGNAVWQVIQGSEPIWAEVIAAEPRLDTSFARRERIESAAAFPLRFADDIVGAMFFNYRRQHQFTQQEKDIFAMLAQVVAASVRDAAFLEEAQRERERLGVINEIGEIVGSALDSETVIEEILSCLKNRFPSFVPYVMLYEEREEWLRMTLASLRFYPMDRSRFAHLLQLPLAQPTLVTEVARRSLVSRQVEMLLAADVVDYVAYVPVMAKTRSQFCLTLMNEGRLLGVFSLECTTVNGFAEGDVATLRGIGHQISLALDRVERSRRLQFQQTVAGAMAWASELAHDINRDVGLMRQRARWIVEDGEDRGQVRRWAGDIEAGAERLVTTMEMSRMEVQRVEEPYVLDEVLQRWVQGVVRKRSAGVEMGFVLGCRGVRLTLFRGMLQRVVNHLVQNALDAMLGEEKRPLSPMPPKPLLTIMTRLRENDCVDIMVADNGPGIAEAVRQTVLQEPRSTKVGTRRGYGLLFARWSAEMLGGDLRLVPSDSERGTTFCLTIPKGGV